MILLGLDLVNLPDDLLKVLFEIGDRHHLGLSWLHCLVLIDGELGSLKQRLSHRSETKHRVHLCHPPGALDTSCLQVLDLADDELALLFDHMVILRSLN